jgi:hypothetical protein
MSKREENNASRNYSKREENNAPIMSKFKFIYDNVSTHVFKICNQSKRVNDIERKRKIFI